ncbi:MAG: lipopolysaccharide kinase InaA family protein [Gemmatimonadota bacterium]
MSYRRWRQGLHEVAALEDVSAAVVDALDATPSLHAWAAARADASRPGGRGVVHRATLGPRRVMIRHFHRGGWMAPLLGDRYLGRARRPFDELAVSERLRAAGVRTPRVLAAVVTRTPPGYRADLATEWLENGHDFEQLLRPNVWPAAERLAACTAAGATVGAAHRAGLDHPDLHVTNIFVQRDAAGSWTAALLDLDRARLGDPLDAQGQKKNLARLARSLDKRRRAGRLTWGATEQAAFDSGYTRGLRDALDA